MTDLVTVPCPKCRSTRSRVVITGHDRLHHNPGDFSASECSDCGLWFQNPRPEPEALYEYYPDDYRPFSRPANADEPLSLSPARRRYLANHLGYKHLDVAEGHNWTSSPLLDGWRKWNAGVALTPQWVPGGSVLEVGCASGRRLVELRKLGWTDLHGVEMMPAAAETARSMGLAVEVGPVEHAIEHYADAQFDVLIASMVIEHLVEPFETVKQLAAKVKPGGQFLFSTVCRDSLDAREYGTYWRNLDLPRHMVFFRKEDIHDLVTPEFEGLELTWQAAPLDFVGSAAYRARDKATLLDKILIGLGEKRLYYPSLAAAFLGMTSRVSARCRRAG